jgi:hypothetical protein
LVDLFARINQWNPVFSSYVYSMHLAAWFSPQYVVQFTTEVSILQARSSTAMKQEVYYGIYLNVAMHAATITCLRGAIG